MPTSLADRFMAYQTTSGVTPASCRVRFFRIRLRILPPVTPESRSQRSTRTLHQAGTGTVLSRPPFPAKSTTTQWFSATANDPQPSSRLSTAASLLPNRVLRIASFNSLCASSPVSQSPILRPSCLTPLTRRIPVANSGLNHPLSAALVGQATNRGKMKIDRSG